MENVNSAKPQKSRHLPILEFYECLQIEYIQADLRHKIYPKVKDKAYWNRVKEGKKATIEKLSEKNSLPSIFTDEAMLRQFEKQVYRDASFPNFTYRDEKQKLEQEFYDMLYYYHKGADVRVDDDGQVLIGRITQDYVPFKDLKVSVTINGAESQYNIKYVTRIL